MDKHRVIEVINLLKKVLDEAGTGISIKFKVGSAAFSSNHATIKVDVYDTQPDGSFQTKEQSAFVHQAALYGLSPTDLGKKFNYADGHVFRVAGLRPRCRRSPVMVEREDGKMYKMPVEIVRMSLIRDNGQKTLA